MIDHEKITISHEGILDLNGLEIPCFVLKDGTRLLSTAGMQKCLGIGENGPNQRSSGRLNEILSSKVVKPYLVDSSNPAKYEPISCYKGNQKISGYPASLLPDICDAILKAKDSGVGLGKRQKTVARQAEIIIRSLAKVGIIALVDEATGYQYDRERDELQKILRAYIAEELLAWQKKFPDVFYKEIFRLNGWDYTVSDIKKRPSVIGTWTNKLIYEKLPKGVLKELKDKTPRSDAGNYTARLHQSLTEDIGSPHLQAQINSVIPLMQISDTWQQFIQNFNKMISRRDGQLEMKFEDLEYKGEPKTVEDTKFNKTLEAIMKVPKPDKN